MNTRLDAWANADSRLHVYTLAYTPCVNTLTKRTYLINLHSSQGQAQQSCSSLFPFVLDKRMMACQKGIRVFQIRWQIHSWAHLLESWETLACCEQQIKRGSTLRNRWASLQNITREMSDFYMGKTMTDGLHNWPTVTVFVQCHSNEAETKCGCVGMDSIQGRDSEWIITSNSK